MERMTFRTEVEVENFQLRGADDGDDPIFGHLEPDDTKAYVTYDICKGFPNVIGPEMSGAYFGFHPQVLANSFQSLLHQQMNLNHALKAYGAKRDRIVGGVVGVAFAEEPEGGWEINVEDPSGAPSLHVAAVLWKLTEGMPKMLGEHMSSRRRWSTSIEVEAALNITGVYRRSTNELYGPNELPPEFAAAITREDGMLRLGQIDGEQLAWAMGTREHAVKFQGVAMTPTPAERTAKITSLKAETDAGAEQVIRVAASSEEFRLPVRVGETVRWARVLPKDPGKGVVKEIYVDGEHHINGRGMVEASVEDPVMVIKPRGRCYEVTRTYGGLKA